MKWEGQCFPPSWTHPKDAVQKWPCWRLWRDEDGQPKLAQMAEDFEKCDGPVVNCENDQQAGRRRRVVSHHGYYTLGNFNTPEFQAEWRKACWMSLILPSTWVGSQSKFGKTAGSILEKQGKTEVRKGWTHVGALMCGQKQNLGMLPVCSRHCGSNWH